jgi:hypothetical protein
VKRSFIYFVDGRRHERSFLISRLIYSHLVKILSETFYFQKFLHILGFLPLEQGKVRNIIQVISKSKSKVKLSRNRPWRPIGL